MGVKVRERNMKIILVTMMLFLATAAGAAELAVDSVGCREKRDLWVVMERHEEKTTRAFLNIESCFILREGKKVKLIQHSKYMEHQFSQVEADGRKLWVISDFLYK